MIYRTWRHSSSLRPAQTYGDNHWNPFQEARSKFNQNLCNETNELVLRLDNLINGQESVDWIPNELVKLCPFCASNFSIAKRRHHCRTCGAVLCNDCSRFLSYKDARKLVTPRRLYADRFDRIEDRINDNSADDKPSIRACIDCFKLLSKRVLTIEAHYAQPDFVDLYEKLRDSMSKADELLLSHRVAKTETHELKQKVITLSSQFGKMAKAESGKLAYLFGAISQSVGYWLKEDIDSKANRVHGSRAESSWAPEQVSDVGEDENPFLVQIKNIERYIEQARLEERFEEVAALEESKRDLEIEYLIERNRDLTV